MTDKKPADRQDEDEMEQEQAKRMAEEDDAPAEKERDDVVELLKAMAIAAVIALFIRSFMFEPFNIPSGSMYPTLLVGDYLFVKKWSYGYSTYSFPLDAVPIDGRVLNKPPARGDVAVFRQPMKPGVDYIKRIIGLPGDKVQVINGRVHLNGEILPRDYKGAVNFDERGVFSVFQKYVETLPNGVKHEIFEISDHEPLDNTEEFTVPEGKYFVMGDNRDQSLDSRVPHEVGFVPERNLIGPAVTIFFSTEGIGDKCVKEGVFAALKSVGCKLVAHLGAIRYSRMFRSVDSIN